MAGERGRLAADALLQVAVAGEAPDVVVERARAGGGVRVEQAALAAGRDGHADRVADALAERAGGGLHAGRVAVLGVAGGERAPLPQRLEVLEGQPVAGEVQLDVQGEAGVSAGQHEPVPPGPGGVGRVVPQHALEQEVGGGSQAHRGAGVAVAGVLDGIHGEDPGRVHGLPVRLGPCEGRLGLLNTRHKRCLSGRTGLRTAPGDAAGGRSAPTLPTSSVTMQRRAAQLVDDGLARRPQVARRVADTRDKPSTPCRLRSPGEVL